MCSGSRSVGRRTTPSGKSEIPLLAGSRSRGSLKASAHAAACRASDSRASYALEVERARVDAVAETRRVGPVVEHVTEVAAAGGARDLGACHPVAGVRLRDDAVERRRLVEARPAAARLELRVGAEELRAAAGAAVHTVAVLVPVCARESTFRSLLAENLVLLGREALTPLLLGQLCLRFHGARVPVFSRT